MLKNSMLLNFRLGLSLSRDASEGTGGLGGVAPKVQGLGE